MWCLFVLVPCTWGRECRWGRPACLPRSALSQVSPGVTRGGPLLLRVNRRKNTRVRGAALCPLPADGSRGFHGAAAPRGPAAAGAPTPWQSADTVVWGRPRAPHPAHRTLSYTLSPPSLSLWPGSHSTAYVTKSWLSSRLLRLNTPDMECTVLPPNKFLLVSPYFIMDCFILRTKILGAALTFLLLSHPICQ